MRDYKEPISRVQKRSQLKRLFGIMGGMIFVFAIFIGGVKVGIQIERERVRIAQGVVSPEGGGAARKDTAETDKKPAPSPEKKDAEMRFTFYETLTRKGGVEQETQEKEKAAKKEEPKATETKEEVRKPSPPPRKEEEAKKPPAEEERYFVQVASFKEEETAEGLRNRLAKKKYPVHVVPVEIEGLGLWYRVRLGGYTTLQEAEKTQKRLAAEENIKETRVVSGP
jgi:cell division protein FtsN